MTRHPLDAAVDQVAARLVAVPQDNEAELARRILSALPERSSRRRWLLPQLAAFGAIVVAAGVWTTNDDGRRVTPLPSSAIAQSTMLPGPVTASAPGTRTRTATGTEPLERLEPLEPLEPFEREMADFDRALPSIEPVASLNVDGLGTSVIAPPPLLALPPIEIGEIPMTADFPPRH